MSIFDSLLPMDAVVVEARSPEWWESGLLPEELRYVARASDKRRREFTAGRNCARAALARLGWPSAAIVVGPDRQPIFPSTVCGSITHTSGYCAAAVIQKDEVHSIGIDAEFDMPMEDAVARMIMIPQELAKWYAHGYPSHAEVLVFSLKEAFYKAAFPFCRRHIGFKEVVVHPAGQHAHIELVSPRLADELTGLHIVARVGRDGQRIYCAVFLIDRLRNVKWDADIRTSGNCQDTFSPTAILDT
ncbi:4'-phosphopantetheinyl transferase family protein [Chromobacterium phragmitis]|uniref:4'-phosphopantetheinyl transferase family protein n=1 Tax=Chromobacterium phragmitis TaxID=2202141 RepID=UPI00143D5F9D|nr:4'-phosphopantetheinyl transferase superfamily protein [Chromobacterium phragmitis]